MMPKRHSLALLFFLVFLVTTTSARNLAAKQGKLSKQTDSISSKESDAFDKLMGVEDCQNEDEECLRRRIIAEAHLDYIYTQHHKP